MHNHTAPNSNIDQDSNHNPDQQTYASAALETGISPLRASCQLQPWSRTIHLRLARRHKGKLHTANRVTFSETPEGQAGNPALAMQYEDAQQLLDELWACGLRPSEILAQQVTSSTNHTAVLAATERHLKDMRDMAFCLLGGSNCNRL
ncbi:hypothetical protein [Undibacterium sp. TS12]|uniref:hypothetical protein n=1 Tax=Undibacterium sp. TS12 TaxID=2908202 RepID=UPI001F4CF305|nr:hypothetical protein [Undibacterium sp. TS12]MCH8622513.1 hypothetical protein [Undibacterium sp. TS12]